MKLVGLVEGPEENVTERRACVSAPIERLKAEGATLANAIAAGGELKLLLDPLEARDRELKAAEHLLRILTAASTVRASTPEIRREALTLLDEWRGLLGRNVGLSRQLLRKLLDHGSQFVLCPIADPATDERWYEIGWCRRSTRSWGRSRG